MSGDDHFIKPDNDHPAQHAGRYSDRERRLHADIEAQAAQLAEKDAALAACRETIEVMHAEQVLWRQTHRTLTEEIERYQRNLRHWREECGMLHAKRAIAMEALSKFADEANWKFNKRFDPNSADFDGIRLAKRYLTSLAGPARSEAPAALSHIHDDRCLPENTAQKP